MEQDREIQTFLSLLSDGNLTEVSLPFFLNLNPRHRWKELRINYHHSYLK
jgi:hypothetical protein